MCPAVNTLEERLKVIWKEDEAKVAIDNIAAATSPLLTSVGFSGWLGSS